MFKGLFTPAVKAVNEVAKTFVGDKSARESNAAQADMAALNQYAAEFRENRNWYDSLVDGLNRLIRPALAFSVLGMFPLAYYNPKEFAVLMASMALIPEQLWSLVLLIIGFYLPSRMIEKVNISRVAKGISAKQAELIRIGAEKVIAMKVTEQPIDNLPWGDNPSINEWRKKHGRVS